MVTIFSQLGICIGLTPNKIILYSQPLMPVSFYSLCTCPPSCQCLLSGMGVHMVLLPPAEGDHRHGKEGSVGQCLTLLISVSTDVDECATETHLCPGATTCINTLGSYKCQCSPGWAPKLGISNKQEPICEGAGSTCPHMVPHMSLTLRNVLFCIVSPGIKTFTMGQ